MNPDRIAHRVLDLIRHPRQPHEIAAAITTNRHPVTPQVVLAALINLERDGKARQVGCDWVFVEPVRASSVFDWRPAA